MVETLKQDQYQPMPVDKQVMIIYAATNGYFDDMATKEILRFEDEFFTYVESSNPEIGTEIMTTGKLSEEMEAKLKQVLTGFKNTFVSA